MEYRLTQDFYLQDAVSVAEQLLGARLCTPTKKYIITETEAYAGVTDLACHASKARTPRTEVMFQVGGKIYVYLIYGMYWLLNFTCAGNNNPHAVLVRGIEGVSGPGRVGRHLKLNKSYYGESLITSKRIWLEEGSAPDKTYTSPRIGVDYAGEYAKKPWRFSTFPP